MTQFAFVLGTGRCGSTMLAQLLALHPDVGFISNLDDRLTGLNRGGRGNARLYRGLPPGLQRRGGRRGGRGRSAPGFSPSEAYRLLGRHVSPMLVDPCRDLTAQDAHPWLVARLRAFFEQRAEAQGRPLFMHKFTGWPRAGLLQAALPESRIVHVLRDGRAVACSLLQQPWWRGYGGPTAWSFGPLSDRDRQQWDSSEWSFAVLAALEWRLLMEAFDAARERAPAGTWMDVRYEDLVVDPRGQVAAVLDHLGLDWTPRFERVFAAITWDADRQAAYARELPPADLDRIQDLLSATLRAHGYPPG